MARWIVGAHIQLEVLSELSGVSQDLATLERDQSSKRPRIKPRKFEAEATIHAVGCELESLLLDVVLCAKVMNNVSGVE